MEVQVSNVVEKVTSKHMTRKEKQIKKIKEKFMKENRILWDGIDEQTAELCKFMKIFVESRPSLMGDTAEEAEDKFFELVAHQQYKALRKAKMAQPKMPKEAKAVKAKPAKVIKPKQVKAATPKVVKEVNPPTPQKPTREQKAFNQLYQKFSALTDQELASEFVLSQYTWLKEPKQGFWCTICEKKFDKLYGLNRHFKRHEQPIATTQVELKSTDPTLSPSEQPNSPESSPSSPSQEYSSPDSAFSQSEESSPNSSFSVEDYMSISFEEA